MERVSFLLWSDDDLLAYFVEHLEGSKTMSQSDVKRFEQAMYLKDIPRYYEVPLPSPAGFTMFSLAILAWGRAQAAFHNTRPREESEDELDVDPNYHNMPYWFPCAPCVDPSADKKTVAFHQLTTAQVLHGAEVAFFQRMLEKIHEEIAIHGPFLDMDASRISDASLRKSQAEWIKFNEVEIFAFPNTRRHILQNAHFLYPRPGDSLLSGRTNEDRSTSMVHGVVSTVQAYVQSFGQLQLLLQDWLNADPVAEAAPETGLQEAKRMKYEKPFIRLWEQREVQPLNAILYLYFCVCCRAYNYMNQSDIATAGLFNMEIMNPLVYDKPLLFRSKEVSAILTFLHVGNEWTLFYKQTPIKTCFNECTTHKQVLVEIYRVLAFIRKRKRRE